MIAKSRPVGLPSILYCFTDIISAPGPCLDGQLVQTLRHWLRIVRCRQKRIRTSS